MWVGWGKVVAWVFATPGRAWGILCLVALGPVLPLVYLARYAHPSADDYAFLFWSRDFDRAYVDLYLTWHGRYASNLLALANPFDDWGLQAYRVVPILLVVATGAGFIALYRGVLGRALGWGPPCGLGILSLSILLFQLPTLPEGIYWYTGGVTYQVPNILFLFYAASLVAYFKSRPGLRRALHLGANAMLVLVMGGFNEGFTLLLVLFHAFALYKSRKVAPEATMSWGVLALCSVVAMVVVLAAPGNAVRGAYFTDNHQIGKSLLFTGFQAVRFFAAWTSTAPLLLGATLLFFFVRGAARDPPLLKAGFFLTPREGVAWLFVIFAACVFPSYWFTGVIGQHRTLNTAYFFFLLVAMLNVTIWARELRSARLPEKVSPTATVVMLLLLVTATATTQNGYAASYDIVYRVAQGYDEEQQARYVEIDRALASGSPIATVSPLVHVPRSIFVLDLSTNPESWVNRDMGRYYGVRIEVVSPGEPSGS